MRLLVGTFYTIENEFDACVASIRAQSYQDFEHVVFRNLLKKEAHERLRREFMERSEEFGLMIRVDADMVIEDRDLFAKIVRKFEENPWMDMLQIAVHDWYPDQLLWGMHIYRNTVKWEFTNEDLFVDNTPVRSERRLNDWHEMAPAAIHCPNPSPFQAFHYGMHRGLKILQPDRHDKQLGAALAHLDVMDQVWANFQTRKDVRLALAVLGAELALTGTFKVHHKDYANDYAERVFTRYDGWEASAVAEEVQKLRRGNWGFLSNRLRPEILWYLRSGDRGTALGAKRLAKGLIRVGKQTSLAGFLRAARLNRGRHVSS